MCLASLACAPCAAAAGLAWCCRRRRASAPEGAGAGAQRRDAPGGGPAREPGPGAGPGEGAALVDSPLVKIVRRTRFGWLLRFLLRRGMAVRIEDHGQWGHGRRRRMADYLGRFMERNAGACEGVPLAFSEHLFHCLMPGWSYDSFGWTRAPVGGDCGFEPLGRFRFLDADEGGGAAAASAAAAAAAAPEAEAPAPRYSDGRLQRLLRAREDGGARLRLSFVYGDEDWMDLRAAADVRREAEAVAPGSVPIACVRGSGHQLPLDHPEGLAEAVLSLALWPAAEGTP